MISFIKGTVEQAADSFILLDCNGVGYKIFCSGHSLQKISEISSSETIKVLTHTYIKEDIIALYGFMTQAEKDMFELLITVNGVGPRVAMTILSSSSPEQLTVFIASEDIDMLTKSPGVGKKTASRIILDLKDKINLQSLPAQMRKQASLNEVSGGAAQDALSALTSLGYSKNEALTALSGMDMSLPADKIIKAALKKIVENR